MEEILKDMLDYLKEIRRWITVIIIIILIAFIIKQCINIRDITAENDVYKSTIEKLKEEIEKKPSITTKCVDIYTGKEVACDKKYEIGIKEICKSGNIIKKIENDMVMCEFNLCDEKNSKIVLKKHAEKVVEKIIENVAAKNKNNKSAYIGLSYKDKKILPSLGLSYLRYKQFILGNYITLKSPYAIGFNLGYRPNNINVSANLGIDTEIPQFFKNYSVKFIIAFHFWDF